MSGEAYGGAGGIDGALDGLPVLVGAAISGSRTTFSLSGMNSRGSVTNIGLNLYGVAQFGAGYVSAIGFVGRNSANFERDLSLVGVDLDSSVPTHGVNLAGRFEAGYRFALPGAAINAAPFLALQPMQVWQNGASEIFGALGRGVTFSSAAVPSLPMYLGAQFDGNLATGGEAALVPFLRAAWMHDFLPDRSIKGRFAQLSDLSFDASGTSPIADAAVIRAGFRYDIDPQVSLSASLSTELSSAYSTIGATTGIRVLW